MSIILTKKFLETHYSVKNMRVREIAALTGLSYPYVQAKIKDYRIPRKRQYENLKNKPFGKLIVEQFVGTDCKQQALWNCLCECGKHKIVKASRLKSGEVKSCGCLHQVRVGDIDGHHFANIRAHARQKKMKFTITIEQIWNLYLMQDGKCALSGVNIGFDRKNKPNTTASLDRIESSRGYTIDNVQWVHKDINQMKSDRTEDYFIDLCRKVVNHMEKR